MSDAYWSRPLAALADEVGSGPGGLTSQQADQALEATRSRAVNTHRRTGSWTLLARQFTSPIIVILLIATAISGALGDLTDAVIIVVIVLGSGLLDFWQERGAANAMDALLVTVQLHATVRRDGQLAEVPFDAVVPGDVVVVAAGDILPADSVLVSANDMEVDQSSLTGETFPATKQPGISAADAALGERSNVLYAGTHVASGSGEAMVVRTGRDTEFGQVVSAVQAKPRPTGFERGMTRFGLLLARIMVVLVVIIFIINLVLDRPFIDSALFSLSLAVGLTPQLLPAIVGMSLAQGARAIAAERVIVKRLNAIEDFGAMTVLCTDKTGTMTQGSIHLDSVIDTDGRHAPRVLQVASWNASNQRGLANPLDQAITQAAHVATFDTDQVTALDEVPYDFGRKRLSVLVQAPGAQPTLVTKGAVASMLSVCSTAQTDGDNLVALDQVRDQLNTRVEDMGARGMRVLAVATKPMPSGTSCALDDEAEMTLIGLLGFADPVKPDAAETVADFAAAGVSVRMITGDSLPAARHIASQLGLDVATAMTGGAVAALSDGDLVEAVRHTEVYCETSPQDKARIVAALSRSGQTVGYMGDGINDAPALKVADVAISVKGAADVAAESASIVMLEKNLGALLKGMRQGRRTFANTMKYLYMTTSANFGNMISMAIASVVLPFLPLTAAQILAVNLLTDLPATAISTDAVDPAQTARPQHWNLHEMVRFLVVFGLVSSVFDIITFVVLRLGFDAGVSEFQTAWFTASVLTEVAVIFSLRTRRFALSSRPSRALVALSVAMALVTLAVPYTPLGDLLDLEPLPGRLMGLLVVIVLAYVGTTEVTKRFFWRPSSSGPGRSPQRPVAPAPTI